MTPRVNSTQTPAHPKWHRRTPELGFTEAEEGSAAPRPLRPAFHLRLTGRAWTHHYSLAEAAKGNTHVTNELMGNTYLPHQLAFPVHAKVEVCLLPFDPDLTAKSVCFH